MRPEALAGWALVLLVFHLLSCPDDCGNRRLFLREEASYSLLDGQLEFYGSGCNRVHNFGHLVQHGPVR